MSMSKHNFEAAALITQDVEREFGKATAEVVCASFAGLFRTDNPRFDAGRFKRACNLGANIHARESAASEAPRRRRTAKRRTTRSTRRRPRGRR